MRYLALLLILAMFAAACGETAPAADPERFCEILAELDTLSREGLTPDEVLEVVREENEKFAEGVDVVPDEIKIEADLVREAILASNDVMTEAGGDFTKIDQVDLESLSAEYFTAEFEDAARTVGDWRTANCT